MNFDKAYTKYWSSTVNKSVDGTIIAGAAQVEDILRYLSIEQNENLLDLGCSFGRLHDVLTQYSKNLFGVDVDPYAVEKTERLPYKKVRVGSGEKISFDNDSFDMVFCWAVFDVIDHSKGLLEINRVLKKGGKLLITGKNDNYFLDDELAYKAEKNAFLKGFPNRFTNLSAVLRNFGALGYELDKLLIFPRRGDLGLSHFTDQGDTIKEEYLGYEYLILCHKISDKDKNDLNSEFLEMPFSKAAKIRATNSNFKDIGAFFQSIGID